MLPVLFGNTTAIIPNIDINVSGAVHPRPDVEPSPIAQRLNGVGRQVEKNLLQLSPIRLNRWQVIRNIHANRDVPGFSCFSMKTENIINGLL